MCNENERKIAMEDFILKLSKAIIESPLYKIKGECRFITHVPEEIFDENFDFDDNDVEIKFSFKEDILGQVIPRQENFEAKHEKEDAEYNLAFNFKLMGDKNLFINVFIRFSGKWPYLHEFGEFIACV
jgi:hypothetical protein